MVRITKGEVSVRIGGGWEPLVEFLDRHDPNRCRFHDSVRESTRRELLRANSLKQAMQTNKPANRRQSHQI